MYVMMLWLLEFRWANFSIGKIHVSNGEQVLLLHALWFCVNLKTKLNASIFICLGEKCTLRVRYHWMKSFKHENTKYTHSLSVQNTIWLQWTEMFFVLKPSSLIISIVSLASQSIITRTLCPKGLRRVIFIRISNIFSQILRVVHGIYEYRAVLQWVLRE